jgi:type I restriction-modification system DNA methylase subunit/restriction endonuclease S subunit
MSDNNQMEKKVEFINAFKHCLNILRDNEGLTGEKALRNLSYLLILKSLEPHLDGELNINAYEFDFAIHDDNIAEGHHHKLLYMLRFTNLVTQNPIDIHNLLTHIWDEILAVHPVTKKIFLQGKGFEIRRDSTYQKLFKKLNSIHLTDTDCDILGNAYEEVIQDIMTGKVLGQFFTQPLIKKIMIKLIDPQIHSDGKIETCGDPTMGTGGFLTSYLQYILQQAKNKNIIPDWDFIKTEGLYGKELEPDTFQLAVSNMLISSGHFFEGLEKGDSIRDPITKKFDNILANPPYGIKGLKYNDFQSPVKSEYIPIKTDSAVSLFIQAIIYMLKINGKCAVVLPDGQDLFSKTNATLIAVREYLMKTCDLQKIIYLPSGVFNYTTINTCIFYFVKKREGTDVLQIKTKISTKNQKETGRAYMFTEIHQTSTIQFYNYNVEDDSNHLLVEVPIEDIVHNSYSLNYVEYMNVEEKQYKNGVTVKKLGEICVFLPKSKKHASYGKTQGKYMFFTSSQICDKYCDEYDYEDECLIIGTGGTANIKCSDLFSCSTDNFVIKLKTEYLTKYIYYYLLTNIDILQKGFVGVGLQHISKEFVANVDIPMPSLEHQQEIVRYLDFIYEQAIYTSNKKIRELKQLNECCLTTQKRFGGNKTQTLGEVCKVRQGTYIRSDMKIHGEYPVYGGGNISDYINQYNREDEIIVAKDGVSAECVRYEHGRFFLNHHGWTIDCNEKIIKKYMFYYLQSIQSELLGIAKGAAQLGINQENFYKLKIKIPSLEHQSEIVECCESNDTLIKQLYQEIENHKKEAKQFLNSVLLLFSNHITITVDKKEELDENIFEEQCCLNGKRERNENDHLMDECIDDETTNPVKKLKTDETL